MLFFFFGKVGIQCWLSQRFIFKTFVNQMFLGGGFKFFWCSPLPGGMIPIWLICFKGVETTNQIKFKLLVYGHLAGKNESGNSWVAFRVIMSSVFCRRCVYGCFLKWWYPQKHPKMIIFSRKTHGCWVPAFRETPIYFFWTKWLIEKHSWLSR